MDNDGSALSFPLILTLDLGTTSVRALLFDRQGRAVSGVLGRQPTPVRTNTEGGAEIDVYAITEAIAACIDEALAEAGPLAGEIGAVACDTFWHNIVGLDAADTPVTPLLTWADTRPASAIPTLHQRLDALAYHARTGCFIHPSYVPAKVLWLREQYADRAITQWLSLGEWLIWQWFGERVVSVGMASGSGLLDVNRQTWDDLTLEALGVSPSQLSPLADQDHVLRGLRPAWAARWPTLATIPWTLPIGDGAASNLGCGAVVPDRLAVMIATSAVMRAVVTTMDGRPQTIDDRQQTADDRRVRSLPLGWATDDPRKQSAVSRQPSIVHRPPSIVVPPGLWGYRADGRRALIGGALSNGGNFLAWLRDTLKLPTGEALEQAVAGMTPDQHGLTWLPFLAGERSVGWRSDAQAALVGMTWATTPLDIYRSACEILGQRLALIYDRLLPHVPATHMMIATGGGLLGSGVLRSIVADSLGRPIVVSSEPEASARGAALLTLETLGWLPSLERATFEFGEPIEPNMTRHATYRAALERHQALYTKLLGE